MDNWLVFIIVAIFIISSLLNKKTKTVSQGPIAKPYKAEAPSPVYTPDRREVARQAEQRQTEQRHHESRNITKEEQVKKHNAYSLESPKQNSRDFTIDINQAAKGIIWAEILGTPRSKRPHSLRQR